MKTIAARDAKNHFGSLIDDARSEPILVERNGRRAVIVLAPEKYDELIAAQDALWEARALEIEQNSTPLASYDGMRVLGSLANVQVGRWGSSLGVRIPGFLARELGLHDGSELDLQQVSGALVLRPMVKNEIKYSLEEMLADVTPESIHAETDWGLSEGKEEW